MIIHLKTLKEVSDELTQKLYYSTLAILKYIGELKDPPEPLLFSSPIPPHSMPLNNNSQGFPNVPVPANMRSVCFESIFILFIYFFSKGF